MIYRMSITLGVMAGVLVLSTLPAGTSRDDATLVRLVTGVPWLLQKLLHIVLYGVLALLWTWTLYPLGMSWVHVGLCVLVLTIGFGAIMEWLQMRIPGRFGTWTDVGLDAAGAALGFVLAAMHL